MHILIGVVLVLLLLWYFSRRPASAASTESFGAAASPWSQQASEASVPRSLAFVARGKLFCARAGESLREVHSPHVQAVMDRLERSRELHGWKEGTAFGVSAMGRHRQGPAKEVPIRITTAQFLDDDRLLYFLRDNSMGGLFEQSLSSGSERRLLHRQNLLLDDLQLSPDRRQILCSQQTPTGVANIAVVDTEGDGYRELTGGDTVDTAPAWVPGKPNLLVFQSQGLARSNEGYVVGAGSASIQLLDRDSGELSTVLEHPQWDHLQPRVDSSGNLLFIRRPYKGQQYGSGEALKDALLFPFRLIRALFHYLNFFSLMYSRKPLTSASGPEVQADLKDIVLQGRRLDAEAALRQGLRSHGVASLVPANWQLVRRDERGNEHVLATHVASFDIARDGGIVYSNGYAVFALDAQAAPQLLLKDKLVAGVIAG